MITEYVKGTPYFCDTNKKIKQYPYLDRDISCEVLIVGGGIDGAIAAYYLSLANIDVVMIDKARFGLMNTSCATALLEYQLDEHAEDLTKYLKKEEITNAYRIGQQALKDIKVFIKKNGNKCHYSARPTFLFTQNKGENDEIVNEVKFRQENGFEVELQDENNNKFPFDITSGILCADGGAEFNPYLFEKQMIEAAQKNGARFFENTEAININYSEKQNVVLTQYQNKIFCNKIVCATGYNTKLFTSKRICNKLISYTIVTSPTINCGWYERALLHDNSDPYHYIRLSPDNRIILGGEDIPFKNDTIKDDVAEKKYKELEEFLYILLPNLKGKVSIDYKFCGAFASTLDNLAIIGPGMDNNNLWYCVGYGANGIVYSVVGGQMLAKLYYGEVDKNLYLFSPDRKLV